MFIFSAFFGRSKQFRILSRVADGMIFFIFMCDSFLDSQSIIAYENFGENMLYFIVGLVLSPITTYLVFIIINRKIFSTGNIRNIKFKHIVKICFYAIWEELIWRTIFFSISIKLFSGTRSIILIFVIILFNSVVFVMSHDNFEDFHDFVDMLIFSILLGLTCIYIPFANYGLHIGRNLLIYREED